MNELIRRDFPILDRKIENKPFVYLDNAATSQRPKKVIDAMMKYYVHYNANVHRGVYHLSQEATDAFESVRGKIARFIAVASEREIIFTKGTTESINLVAASYGEANVKEGDVIAVTRMEHHANFVPWQQLAKRKKARFEIIGLTPDLRLDPKEIDRVLALKPKILAISLLSNVTGVVNPIASLATRFKMVGSTIVVDAAQGIAHGEVTIDRLGPVDFLAFSSHKICGPTGVGILWGREALLEKMPPYQFGGNMITHVGDLDSEWNELPHKFEAGTPDIAGVIGLGAAIDYFETLGRVRIEEYEHKITSYVLQKIKDIACVKLLGPREALHRAPIFSVAIDGVHAHDLATFLDMQGISVRAGHHCAHPLMFAMKCPATCRASFSFYNTLEEADLFVNALKESQKFFAKKPKSPENGGVKV
ncbi:MAG: SufS family cysteine desulfurase [Bdellovibrionales bacterium]|nr:SufS family cysteine desulfurase [Bdellovibrionales bacterium]